MKDISVSVDVFAMIWTLREEGEINEDQILKRVLSERLDSSERKEEKSSRHSRYSESSAGPRPLVVRGEVQGDDGMAQFAKVRWVDDIRQALTDLGGEATLFEIYKVVERIRREAGRSLTKTWEATIRRTLEDHSSDSENYRAEDLFYMPHGKGAGVWALRKKR